MAKFSQKKSYAFDLHAYIDALAHGHFNRKHNTVWTAFNRSTDALMQITPLQGKVIKSYFRNVAATYPGTGTRGAKDKGARNASHHISALVKYSVLKEV